MHVEEHESLEELLKLTRQQKRVREHRRFQAVVLARQGKTAGNIAAILDCGLRPVQRWIERKNKGGAAGLFEGQGRGRKRRLAREQEQKLKDRLDAGPRPSDSTCAFHGKDIQGILQNEFGVILKLSAVYWLLHQLGCSRLCPRPHHPDADPTAQDAFKKTPWNRCKRSRRPILKNASRSGLRTRRDSASRER